MPIGDGKAKKEVQDLKQEFAFMYDAITSLGDKLIGSFEQAVDEAGNMSNAFEIASKTFQRGLAADLKQSVKNTDALIDLYSKLGRDAISQKDIAKEQEKIDSNRLRLQIKRKALGNNITAQQKEFFTLQQDELSTQQNMLNTINAKNDKLQKQKGIFQLIKENAGGVADKIDKSGTLSKVLSGNLLKTLTPLRIFELVVVGIVDAFLSLDKTTEKVAQNLGISFHEAAGMNQQFSQIAQDSNNIFVTTEGIANSQIQLSAALGTNAMFTAEMLQTQTELTHQLGLSAETGGEIAKLGLLTGKTSKEIAANVMGQSVAMNAANKTAITEKSILQEVAKLSSSIQLSLGNNPVALAEAVQTAKRFGMELSKVDGIAGSLMNFEQSIGAELEAELLLGKNINLEKARQAALNNDLATVAEEIAEQAGSAAEFTAMNRIQQEALAKAVGMSKEDLAKSLQSKEILAKLGGKDADMQAAYNRLKAEGLSQEEIANKLGDERLAQSLHSEGIQSQFTASVAKMKELFVQVAGALIPIVEPIAALVGYMANLISKSMTFLKILGSIVAVYKTLQFLGNSVYRNELLRNAASKIGLITDQQKVLNKGRETALAVEGVGVEQLSNFHKNQGLFTQIKTNAIKVKDLVVDKAKALFAKESFLMSIKENVQTSLANVLGLNNLSIQELRIVAKMKSAAISVREFITDKAGLALDLARNAAAIAGNGIAMIGKAIKKSSLLADIAQMAMRAYSSLSAIPFIGPILGIAGAAAAAGLGYMYYSKADDYMSPGASSGYGSRTITGPEGAIALNNRDTIIAGTDLFNNSSNQQQSPPVIQQDNSKMERLLERAINRPDPVIEMNGDKLGTAVGKYAYSIQ